MGARQFTNNGSALTASSIVAADTQVTLVAGQGTLFPAPGAGQYALCTLEDAVGNVEIVQMTARAGDICTITRAQEGTIARDFPAGSRFELRVTKGVLDSFVQKDGDALTGSITYNGTLISDCALFTTGLMATARLGSGTASANTFLRGNQTWQQLAFSDVTGQIATGQVPAAAVTQHESSLGTESAAVSRVARRDSGGDMQVRLVRSEYAADDSQPINEVAYRVASGASTDNYMRHCTLTRFKRQLFLNCTIQADPGGTPAGSPGDVFLYY